jgi:hypothetical protein
MQLTIEIPDELAEKAESERERLIELIQRTLRQPTTGKPGVIQEVFQFLARRPSSEEILAFRPSAQAVERLSDLLDKNREGLLTTDEESELDTMQSLNHLFALLKVQARHQLRAGT